MKPKAADMIIHIGSELTSEEDRAPEQLRQAVESMMLAAGDRRPDVRTAIHAGHSNRTNVKVMADIDRRTSC